MTLMLASILVGVCLAAPTWANGQKHPDVVGVRVASTAAGVFSFDATISSPYDTPQRYADGFRAMSEDGKTVFGVRPLLHDHASEQPFTRDLYGVQIPPGVRRVVIQGRDRQYGWGGKTQTVDLPGR
jgi:hypothetical protein